MTIFTRASALMLSLTCLFGVLGFAGCQKTSSSSGGIEIPAPVMPEVRTCPGGTIGENVQVTKAIGESNAPQITWANGNFAIAWWDLRGRYPEVRTVRVDKDGLPRSKVRRMQSDQAAKFQTLIWDGEEVNIVWADGETIMSARLGSEDESPKVMAEHGKMPSAGAWGAAVWMSKGKLFFRSDGMLPPLSRDGSQGPSDPPVVIATGGIEDPQVVLGDKLYAVVWSASVKGGREIRLQRVTPKGKKVGKVVKVSGTAGLSRKPVAVWSGDAFAIAWTNAASASDDIRDRYRVFFATVGIRGDMPRMTRKLNFNGSADQVAITATGKEYALAWVGSMEPRGTAIYLQRLSGMGKLLGETMTVTDGNQLTCGRPAVTWAGDGYGVAWHDDRAQTGSEVFFSFVSCGEPTETQPDIVPDAPAPNLKESAEDTGAEDTDTGEAPPELKDVF